MIAPPRRTLPGLLVACLLLALPAAAQERPEAPMPPREPLPPPAGIRPFPTPEIKGRELTLEEVVTIALENQPQIQARLGDYLAARERIPQAISPLLPQLSGSWNGFRNQTVSRSTMSLTQRDVTVTAWSTSTEARVRAEQLLWDFGKALASTDAARSGAESALEDVEIQRDEIVRLVKEAYFNLVFRKRLVKVREAALDRAQVNLRSAKGFFDVGARPKSEVTRAEVDVANARVDLIRALNDVNLTRVTLNQLMGISVNAPTEVKDILGFERFPLEREGLVSEAFRRRPEYRQVKARLDGAEATVRQTFRNFFPDVVGSGSYGAANPDMNEVWTVGVELRWSIFDGGRKIAQHREAKAALEAARARVREVELRVWQEVEQAYLSLIEAEERIGAAVKAVESAQENFRLSQGRFDAGVANIIELTDAQLALTQAQSTEAQALADYRIAIARLERALGRR